MTNPFMHWTRANGKPTTYGGASGDTPVPRPTYRCKSTARDISKKAHSHPCKLTVDHDENEHTCVCGKSWPRADRLAAA